MSTVHVLDDSTINKIAAGEVVERPASVIKELVENSIDAGASRIEVEIMAGGTSFMRVTDNGCGMTREDAGLAIQRHATSKIQAVTDIAAIHTLGFRGEALPTIASVSRFSLLTRRAGDELGTQVIICGSKAPEISEAGGNIGTTIKVEDLFFNTPARKKFLKTTHTEGSKINDFIIKLALANPGIAFRFINNNKTALATPGNGSLQETIQSIYGGNVSEALLELAFADTDIRIDGYITKPSKIRSSRIWQTFIVNGRIIVNKAIARALDNAYHSLLPKSGYPLAVLQITVPQRSLDVNIHPQKSEIKFEDEGRIFRAVYKVVLDAIRPAGQKLEEVAAVVPEAGLHYTMAPMQFAAAPAAASGPTGFSPAFPSSLPLGGTDEPAVSFHEAQTLLQQEKQAAVAYPPVTAATQNVAEPAAPLPENDAMVMIPMGQVDRCYIIAQDAHGLYIVDQHAAHERILYDKFAAQAGMIPSQQLLVHQVLDFDAQETELLDVHQELLSQLGFDMEASGPNQYRLKSVPADIPVSEAEAIIREILESLNGLHDLTAAEIRHACIATTACHAAIRCGDELNLRQMQIVLDELAHTARPYTCPHGRPTILRFSSDELAKMFKRT